MSVLLFVPDATQAAYSLLFLLIHTYHVGIALISLIGFGLVMKYLESEKNKYLWWALILGLLVAISDRVFMLAFSVPVAGAAIYFYWRKWVDLAAAAKVFGVASATAAAAFISSFILQSLNVIPRQNVSLRRVFEKLGNLIEVRFIPIYILIAVGIVGLIVVWMYMRKHAVKLNVGWWQKLSIGSLTALSGILLILNFISHLLPTSISKLWDSFGWFSFLFVITLGLFLNWTFTNFTSNYSRSVQILATLSVTSALVSLVGMIILGGYESPWITRYAMIIPLLGVIWLVYFALQRTSLKNLAQSLTLVSILLICWVSLSGRANLSILNSPIDTRSKFHTCVDEMAPNHNVKFGLGTYWYSKPAYISTENKIRVNQIKPDLTPYIWINSRDWYQDQNGKDLTYTFLVLDELNPEEVKAKWGEPSEIIHCAGVHTIYYYESGIRL